MKKFFALIMSMMLSIAMVACGGSGAKVDESLLGKYIAVSGTALGMTLTGEDVIGFTFELKDKGVLALKIDDKEFKGKWKSDDSTVTLVVDGTDIVGEKGEDTIIFKNFLEDLVGAAMDITFAKEGTDAANPDNYLPEEEKALIGEWVGVHVENALDEDASGEVDPGTLTAVLNSDHTSSVSYGGSEIATPTWSIFAGTVMFEGDVEGGASLYGEYKDGVFKITYSSDNYYTFTMEAQ